MSGCRPFQSRVVVIAPPHRLMDAAGWARFWTEAGADGLALEADPNNPLTVDMLSALRRHTPLPLEVQVPATANASPEWGPALTACEVDCLLPARPPDDATAKALAAAAVSWAWPLAAGPAPAWVPRLHARGAMAPLSWGDGSRAAERSLAPDPGAAPPAFRDCGADTLVLAERWLEGTDPATALAELRG